MFTMTTISLFDGNVSVKELAIGGVLFDGFYGSGSFVYITEATDALWLMVHDADYGRMSYEDFVATVYKYGGIQGNTQDENPVIQAVLEMLYKG
jgi:hypothetical protein